MWNNKSFISQLPYFSMGKNMEIPNAYNFFPWQKVKFCPCIFQISFENATIVFHEHFPTLANDYFSNEFNRFLF